MNLWQIITTASTLPVQPGTNLWQHLNNLGFTPSTDQIDLTGKRVTIMLPPKRTK